MLEGTNLTLKDEPAERRGVSSTSPTRSRCRCPRWKSRWSASYGWSAWRLASYLNYMSAYEDRGDDTLVPASSRFSPGM